MYNIKFRLTVLIFLSFTLISCSDKTVDSYPPAGQADFKYPFRLGSFWYYTTKNFVTNLRPDSLNVYFSTDTITGNGAAEFSRDSVINNDTLRLMSNSHSSAGHSHTTLEYYRQSDSGLIRVAYYTNGTNFGPFRPSPNHLKYKVNGKSFHSLNDLLNYYNNDFYQSDSTPLVFDNPPLMTLKYPVVENSEWDLLTNGTTRISKKYIGFETLVLPSGSFYCVKIKRNWYLNSPTPESNLISYDYFSKEGMVKRDFLIKDVLISNSLGMTIGYIDVRENDFLNLYILP